MATTCTTMSADIAGKVQRFQARAKVADLVSAVILLSPKAFTMLHSPPKPLRAMTSLLMS